MGKTCVDVFFELVRAGLWGTEAQLASYGEIDFEEVYRLAQEQSVVGMLAAGLEHVTDVKVPQTLALTVAGEVLQLEQRNRAMNQFVARLMADMRKAGINTLLVKGQAVAQCYEKPLWRACGDVDFFLSDDNYEKAKAFLIPMASDVETEYVGAKHLGMTINGWVVELHGRLCGGLSPKIERELDDVYVDTFNGGNVRSWDNNGVLVFQLGIENDVFYVFTHILQHFYKEGVGLRQICDWCRLLYTYKDSLDLRLLEQRIRKAGLMSEWRAFGAFAVEYLGMPIEAMPFLKVTGKKENGRGEIDARLRRKADKICKFIMEVGNFGHNRDTSYYGKYPFIVRKSISAWWRVKDLCRHAMIFPWDSLRFFPHIMLNGMKSAVRGE